MADDARRPTVPREDVLKALVRLGFKLPVRQTPGSHVTLHNPQSNKTATVIMGRGNMPDGTLKGILEQAHVSTSEFCLACGGTIKKEEKMRLKRVAKNARAAKRSG